MDEFTTITTILRNNIINDYNKFKDIYYNKITNDDINDTFDDIEEIDFEENIESNFEDEVLTKILNNIKNSKYKNIFYLIIFNDVYEYLKSKEIAKITMFEYEINMLNELENQNLNTLFNIINNDIDASYDYITMFLDYQFATTIDTKRKNKKLIELSNNSKYINKFKISILDDIEYQYAKTRK